MEKTTVFGYVRVSTAGQVKEGFSLEQQKEEIVNFCEENGYDLIKMYEDAGISGAKADEDNMSIDHHSIDLMIGLPNYDLTSR